MGQRYHHHKQSSCGNELIQVHFPLCLIFFFWLNAARGSQKLQEVTLVVTRLLQRHLSAHTASSTQASRLGKMCFSRWTLQLPVTFHELKPSAKSVETRCPRSVMLIFSRYHSGKLSRRNAAVLHHIVAPCWRLESRPVGSVAAFYLSCQLATR